MSVRAIVGICVLAAFAAGCAARVGPDGTPLTEDQRIAQEVVEIIADQDGIATDDLEVEVRDGVVILTGVQSDPRPVGEVLQRASRVRGVVEVINRVRIIRGG